MKTRIPFISDNAFIVFGIVLMLFHVGCDDGQFCRDARGPIEFEEFDMPTFSGVHIKRKARVFIEQGEEQRVRVEAQDNVFRELDLKVRNDVLVIDLDRCFFDLDMDVFITMTEPVTDLIMTGSGRIEGEGQLLAADRLNIEITGSGDIRANLDADEIDTHITGSGDLRLSGMANTHEVSISGSGDLRAFELDTRSTDIRISGSGNAEVFVDGGQLDVRISGSGDVRYKGSPETIDSSVSGSGNVINAN